MKRNPESWMLDFSPQPKWNYCQGLELQAILQVWQKTGVQKYFDYAYSFADLMVEPSGQVKTYKQLEYNIDRVNGGKFLFPLLDKTQEQRFSVAIDLFREQMKWHPRTKKGSFWHKKIYPHQVWLDGLYMAGPFLAEYAKRNDEPELFDDEALKILDVHKYMYDKETGLYYHGWDEWKEQKWADSKTGLSPNFWSRSIGWYMMAIVDVLDFLPEGHRDRAKIIDILKKVSAAVEVAPDSHPDVHGRAGAGARFFHRFHDGVYYSFYALGGLEHIDGAHIFTAESLGQKGNFYLFTRTYVRMNGGGSVVSRVLPRYRVAYRFAEISVGVRTLYRIVYRLV